MIIIFLRFFNWILELVFLVFHLHLLAKGIYDVRYKVHQLLIFHKQQKVCKLSTTTTNYPLQYKNTYIIAH